MYDPESYFTQHEALIRLGCFSLLLLSLLAFEAKWPRRPPPGGALSRRLSNLGLLCINTLAVRLLVPFAAFEVALYAERHGLGLFNLLAWPFVLNVILTVVIFDLLIYAQHVAFHRLPWLWLIHRTHHSDTHFDVTTGVRFHPLEIALSLFYKLLAVLLLGPAAFAVILYEVLLNSAALFTHSNIRVHKEADGLLRMLLVTPDMHRVHHSTVRAETDSNYGNLFSVWDKLFRTYKPAPAAGYERMRFGLADCRDQNANRLSRLLLPGRQAPAARRKPG